MNFIGDNIFYFISNYHFHLISAQFNSNLLYLSRYSTVLASGVYYEIRTFIEPYEKPNYELFLYNLLTEDKIIFALLGVELFQTGKVKIITEDGKYYISFSSREI